MRILHRYILKEILLFFSMSLLVFTGLLFTVKMIRLTKLVINKGVEFDQILLVAAAIIPTFLEFAIPLAALFGCMLAFARLSGDSEIIVIRASGVSLYELLRPAIYFGIGTALLCLFVSLHLRPWGYQTLSKVFYNIARTKIGAGLEPGVFNDLGKFIIYVEELQPETGYMQRVLLDDQREEEVRRVVTGTRGTIQSDASEQMINLNLQDGVIHEMGADRYSVTDYDRYSVRVSSDELLQSDGQKTRRVAEFQNSKLLTQINSSPDHLRAQHELESEHEVQQLRSKLRVELSRRFSMPVAAFILVLVAMPLGIQSPRVQKAWGLSLSTVLGMSVFLIYYGLLSVGIAGALAGSFNPYIATWIPNVVSLLLAGFMLSMVGSERWESVGHGFDHLLTFVSKRLKLEREE